MPIASAWSLRASSTRYRLSSCFTRIFPAFSASKSFHLPPAFDPLVALRLIGYTVADPTAASVAFHRHFRGNDAGELDARDRQILWNLQGKLLRQDVVPPPPPVGYRQLKDLQPGKP